MAGHPEGQAGLSNEIDAGLSAVWSRYVGERPVDTAVEFDGEVVRWTIPDGAGKLDARLGEPSDESEGRSAITGAGFSRETSKVVSSATHRAVSARFSKKDKSSGGVTEVFILSRSNVRF